MPRCRGENVLMRRGAEARTVSNGRNAASAPMSECSQVEATYKPVGQRFMVKSAQKRKGKVDKTLAPFVLDDFSGEYVKRGRMIGRLHIVPSLARGRHARSTLPHL